MNKLIVLCLLVIFLTGTGFAVCNAEDNKVQDNYFYRTKMIDFIDNMSSYAKNKKSGFTFITNGGLELYKEDELPADYVDRLLKAVGGVLVEGSQYTWNAKHTGGVSSSRDTKEYFTQSLPALYKQGKVILSVDYCGNDQQKAVSAMQKNAVNNIITFPARYKELTSLQYSELLNEHNEDVNNLSDVKSFIILLNPEKFANKAEYLKHLKESPADLLIVDLYYADAPLSKQDIAYLQTKKNGFKRLVYSYMSIGEAEDYRYYWQKQWNDKLPAWLMQKNDNWEGNYVVKYWYKEWQNIIYGTKGSYLDKIVAAGFDGAFLDVVDGYQNFE